MTSESGGEKYARGWKAGWAAAMEHIRDEATRQMFEPPRSEPSIPPTREELFTDG